MTTAMSSNRSFFLSLPPELWIRILSSCHDPNHLWSTCRHVSSTFQAYVEQVFAEKYLRQMRIDFDLEKHNLGGKSRRPEVPTSFHRFSNDKARAYFRDQRMEDSFHSKEALEVIMTRWNDQMKESRIECPHYTIHIGHSVNDTELPGLELNIKDREISFGWRGMFQAFFREEERLRILAAGWHQDVKHRLAESHRKVSAGELSMADQLAWSAKLWTAAEKNFRKSIRRARLKAHYQDNKEMLWAINAMEMLDGSNRLLKEVPGGRVGERYFQSMYLPHYLLVDEWSSLNRIDTKAELAALIESKDDIQQGA